MNNNRFICRASSVSDIMSLPRSKTDREAGVLSETAKSAVLKAALKEVFGFNPQISSKYLEKGLALEDDAIKVVGLLNAIQLTKNTERRQNEWITGECDILADNQIRDTKCSWSIGTFPWLDSEAKKMVEKSGYDWQMQCYMWLWDKPEAYIDFVLLPTPPELLSASDDPVDHIELVEQIDIRKRIKSFRVERDDEKIEAIKTAVDRCQDYYNELIQELSK